LDSTILERAGRLDGRRDRTLVDGRVEVAELRDLADEKRREPARIGLLIRSRPVGELLHHHLAAALPEEEGQAAGCEEHGGGARVVRRPDRAVADVTLEDDRPDDDGRDRQELPAPAQGTAPEQAEDLARAPGDVPDRAPAEDEPAEVRA